MNGGSWTNKKSFGRIYSLMWCQRNNVFGNINNCFFYFTLLVIYGGDANGSMNTTNAHKVNIGTYVFEKSNSVMAD